MTDIGKAVREIPPLRAAALALVGALLVGTVMGGKVADVWTLPNRLHAAEAALAAQSEAVDPTIPGRVEKLEQRADRSDARWLHLICRMDGEPVSACERLLPAEDRALLRSMRGTAGVP